MSLWSKLAGPGADLEAHDLVTRAVHAAGVSEFGSNAWSEPLEILTRSINADANLHRDGRRAARDFLVKLLAGRAEAPGASDHEPDNTDGPVPAPIIIVGIDGSGAHHLARAVRSERKRRFPFGTPVSGRVETRLFLQEFTSFEFERRWHVPAYAEWLAESDLTDAYDSASTRLTAAHTTLDWPAENLANGVSDLIVLQGEHHLEHLPLLASAFPGATLVHLHRSPGDCLGESIERLVISRREESSSVDADKVAKYWSWRTALLLDRYVEQRRDLDTSGGSLPIIDLDHEAVSADYASTAAAIVGLGSSRTTSAALSPFLLGRSSFASGTAPRSVGSNGEQFTDYLDWITEITR